MITLKEHYKTSVVPELKEKLGLDSVMAVPKVTKITINMGVGEALNDKKVLERAVEDMALIAGQKTLVTKARKSVANFKIRDGMPIGCKVTLRSVRMYEFLDRLISVALPRTRDFRGLSFKAFDGMGNYNFGIQEQIIFTEINYDDIESIRGLNITIVTTAKTDEEAYWLLKNLGLPLREKTA